MIDLQKKLKNQFKYSHGDLMVTNPLSPRMKEGDIAGSELGNGYRNVNFAGKRFYQHRLVFLYHYGYLPAVVDHIDGDKANNKIENLRAATYSKNNHNQAIKDSNTSGYKGVTWNKSHRSWQAQIMANGKRKYLGCFWDKYTANLVVRRERQILHKEFCNHGTMQGDNDER